jgi:DNA-binding GntR family transcriptional regulator
VTVEALHLSILPAAETVATKLKIPAGSDVVFLERRLNLDGCVEVQTQNRAVGFR